MHHHIRLALALSVLAFAAPLRATEFAAGDGSAASPYVIRNAAQLAKFRDIVNGANDETQNSSACARLAADIDLGGAAWTPIGDGSCPFAGTFDGQGHTIGGFSVDWEGSDSSVYAGLFATIGANGTVKDLGVCGDVAARGSEDYTPCYAGGIAGRIYEHGTVEGCFHVGSVTADSRSESNAGGIVGDNHGTVRNCRHAGPLSSKAPDTAYAGGVVGCNYRLGAVRNCYAVGAVTASGDGDKSVGGVAGSNNGTVENCYYDTTVAGAIVAVGGGDSAGATGKTTAEMQGLDALSRLALNAGLDADAWTATAGYPELKAFVYPLWIGGVRFTAGNLVIDADDDPGIASGTATYDPASNTLWLTNFVYSGPGLLTNFKPRALYYEAHSPDFVIDVSGTNRLALVGAGGYSFGLDFRSGNGQDQTTVTIRSADGGRLSVAADAASYSYGIYAAGADLVIDGAAVSAVGGGPGLYYSFGAYLDWCRLTIKSGSLAAKGGKATNYDSVGVFFSSSRESLFVKGGSLIATGGEAGRASYGIGSDTPLSFTGGETLAQGGTAGIADASLSVADGLAVFAGADADGAAAVEGDGWKNQKCVRIAAAPPAVAATVTFNNGNGAVPYDGQGHGVEVEVTDPAEGAAVLFALGDSSGPTETFGPTAPMFTNVCDETVWVELSAEGYRTTTISAAVTVVPAPLAITAKDQTYAYNGQPQGEGDPVYVDPADIAAKVEVEGLAAGDALASVVLSGHQTDPGVYVDWIVPSSANVTNAMGNATSNYDIGYTNGKLTIEEPPPPVVSNVVARQRWPWNGLVDVDYEISGYTAGLKAEIVFEEQGGTNRWTATKFFADVEPTLNPGLNRATWDSKAEGATDLVATVVATMRLVREE